MTYVCEMIILLITGESDRNNENVYNVESWIDPGETKYLNIKLTRICFYFYPFLKERHNKILNLRPLDYTQYII